MGIYVNNTLVYVVNATTLDPAESGHQVTVTGSDGSMYTLSPSSGTQSVSPTTTTTYTADATGSGGSASANTTVTVAAAGSSNPTMFRHPG